MKRLSRHSSSCLFHRRPVGTEEELLVFIWSGGPLEFFDASPTLQPFSYYQYRVRAHNSKGSVVSRWALAQTLQAKPENMAPPTATPTGELTIVGAPPVWRWCVMWSVRVWHCSLSDRGVLGPSEMEWTSSAQRSRLPVQTDLQEAPTGSNTQLYRCYRSHPGGKRSHDACTRTQYMERER